MKILIITQWFEPEPTFKGLLFASELKKLGHDVEVLTGFPNYPGGNVYDGYKVSLYQKEIVDGVIIHRSALYPSHDSSSIRRILNYVSFAVTSLINGLTRTRNIDVIYSYHPPLTASLSAILLGKLKRVPVVVDIQDLWPDTLTATGMVSNKFVLRIVGKICSFVYSSAAKIVVLSPGFKIRLVDRGVPASKVELIYNWCNEQALKGFSISSSKLPRNGNANVLFAGNLGLAQGLETIVNAAEILQRNGVPMNIIMLGDGVAKAAAFQTVLSKGLSNVFFLPRVPMSVVGGLLNEADILLVHLVANELFEITIPSRTQANMYMGKPILMGVKGDAENLIIDANCGVGFEPGNHNSLALSLESLSKMNLHELQKLGDNGKQFYLDNLSLEVGVKKFNQIFEEVL